MTDYKLPELPEPYYTIRISSPKVPVYTADQLRAMHRQGWDEAIAAIQQQAGHGEAVHFTVYEVANKVSRAMSNETMGRENCEVRWRLVPAHWVEANTPTEWKFDNDDPNSRNLRKYRCPPPAPDLDALAAKLLKHYPNLGDGDYAISRMANALRLEMT